MPVPCRRCSVRHCCPRCSFHGFGRRFACIAIRGSCLTTMKPGTVSPAAVHGAHIACLRPPVAVLFCGTRAVPRIRHPRSWEHAFTAQACDAAADVDAGCVDGYAGFQRIFRMGTLRQLGRQRSCRDRGRHRRLPHWSGALPVFRRPARPEPWPGEHRCADMQLSWSCCAQSRIG